MIGLASLAIAGSIYINGVRADEPPALSMENVDVRIDGSGNVFIDAPGYEVNVVGAATGGPGPTATSTQASQASQAGGAWFLVSEDEGSSGGIIDVYINDRYVRRLQSGDMQVLVDLKSFVVPGVNTAQFVLRQAPAGRLGAYIGLGFDGPNGLRLDAPAVSYRSVGAPQVQKITFEVR